MYSGVKVDSFMLPGTNIPDAMPAEVANENQGASGDYQIPLVVWMVVFLAAGYLGLRWIMED